MATYRIAANMEFVRSADLDFRAGVEVSAKIGYTQIEPMVHTGWGLLSEVGYFHSFSMEEDPLLMKEICDMSGLTVKSLSGHSPLMKPEAAVDRLTRAIVLADAVGASFVNTDEMLKPDWMDDDEAHQAMSYTLKRISHVAARHKVYVCIEPHGIYTKTAEGLLRIVNLVESPWIQVNWDTGNSYLAGVEDPYEGLEKVRDKVRHVHAKDIDFAHSEKDRGKVTGTPVGCACGDGVVEWDRVLTILDPLDREITLSVECGTIEQAKKSLPFLREVVGDRLAADQR
ncbi:MAG: sugar phosphate isomerase/epimerase [Hyphomicrobiales bacterium]|nr:sugar phosphate isomerase/epimerase [Hyphomicrobiales bacterium]